MGLVASSKRMARHDSEPSLLRRPVLKEERLHRINFAFPTPLRPSHSTAEHQRARARSFQFSNTEMHREINRKSLSSVFIASSEAPLDVAVIVSTSRRWIGRPSLLKPRLDRAQDNSWWISSFRARTCVIFLRKSGIVQM